MANSIARKIVHEALDLRARFPQATALEVLDQVMEGRAGDDIDFSDGSLTTGDHTDPREAFGQLLAAAFDDIMSPLEWTNLLAQAVDQLPLLDYWHETIIGTRFAARYRLWGVEPAGGPATAPEALRATGGAATSLERVRIARRLL